MLMFAYTIKRGCAYNHANLSVYYGHSILHILTPTLSTCFMDHLEHL